MFPLNRHDQVRLSSALGALVAWLKTWETERGGYNGFVIHRYQMKRMRYIHDTAWTQAAMIRGYANLYRKSNEVRWYHFLERASDLQYNRYNKDTGKYKFAGHEDDRFSSLVHCALANCALLEAGALLGKAKQNRYVETVSGNVDLYWMPVLWVETEGAFRFSEIDYYSLDEDRFVINFNTMAVECLLKLSECTGESKYEKTAYRVGEWLIEKCNRAREYYPNLITSKSTNGLIPKGGLPYQYTPTQSDPDNCVCLYAGLALRGIAALYKKTKDERYAQIVDETCNFLLDMRDHNTHLFYHTTDKERIEQYPQFIAGAGMALIGIDEASSVLNKAYDVSKTVKSILSYQYKNGSFPSFIGKNMAGKHSGSGVVWEDVVAGVNWNAQIFEYMTRAIEQPSRISIPSGYDSQTLRTNRFYYYDSMTANIIVSWWPIRSMGCYIMKKTLDRALSIYPGYMYNFFLNILKKLSR